MLRSRCDTEVLPHLYEEHGPQLAERLRGMAVAVDEAGRVDQISALEDLKRGASAMQARATAELAASQRAPLPPTRVIPSLVPSEALTMMTSPGPIASVRMGSSAFAVSE